MLPLGAKGKNYGTYSEEAVRIFTSLQELENVADPIAVTQVGRFLRYSNPVFSGNIMYILSHAISRAATKCYIRFPTHKLPIDGLLRCIV